jgi:TadE-like protein
VTARRHGAGQALAEFAIVLPLLVMFILGIVDLGRGVYLYNGVSQAAREIARSASVHPGSPLGTSAETVAVIALQESLVPGIGNPIFHCEYLDGGTVPGDGAGGCAAPNVVRVEVHASYQPASILGIFGTFDFTSSASNQTQ